MVHFLLSSTRQKLLKLTKIKDANYNCKDEVSQLSISSQSVLNQSVCQLSVCQFSVSQSVREGLVQKKKCEISHLAGSGGVGQNLHTFLFFSFIS